MSLDKFKKFLDKSLNIVYYEGTEKQGEHPLKKKGIKKYENLFTEQKCGGFLELFYS
jgi:hypothetical protein